MNDCIAAISTPIGVGALAIVRMSGPGSVEIVGRIFRGSSSPLDTTRLSVMVGRIIDLKTGREIDEVVLTIFRGPESYTGEDMAEICCHGGRYIPTAILELCLREGARAAGGGEFTRRAFLNGKLDLVQAEAVVAMIEATTERAHRLAIDQLERALSREIGSLREELVELMARLEYDIDYSDEEGADKAEVGRRIERARERIRSLIETWREGSLSTEGAVVVIAGRPNVGKSSLFNMMARRMRAIVSPHPGTTRDAIELEVSLSGLRVRLVDTAGLRETEDAVERIGVEVSRNYLEGADIVLFLVDAVDGFQAEDERFLSGMKDKDVIFVVNKIDLKVDPGDRQVLGKDPVRLSAKTGEGMEELKERIFRVALGGPERTGPAITTLRQKRGLEEGLSGLDRMAAGIGEGISAEYLVEDLRTAVRALGELIGEVTTEEILEAVFSRFCVGK